MSYSYHSFRITKALFTVAWFQRFRLLFKVKVKIVSFVDFLRFAFFLWFCVVVLKSENISSFFFVSDGKHLGSFLFAWVSFEQHLNYICFKVFCSISTGVKERFATYFCFVCVCTLRLVGNWVVAWVLFIFCFELV